MRKAPHRVMLSAAKNLWPQASRQGGLPILRCAQHDTREGLFQSMPLGDTQQEKQ